MQKKIVVLSGHPNPEDTLSKFLADTYETAAKESGHELKRFNLGELKFDPILHKGYKVIQELEPDLKNIEDALKWCDHLFIVYPNWWCTMPALLKGLFDRVWLPGFEFHMRRHKDGTQALGWDKLMDGKSARVVVLSGTRPIFIYTLFGDYTNEISRGILGFAGFSVSLTRLGPSEHLPKARAERWRKKIARLGRMGI
ncbi:MAG: NAD(P)H-dependent oxidoreductase [Minisyncoccia bacterium]